jgi:ParB-like chromosome segregation protein Spo0J
MAAEIGLSIMIDDIIVNDGRRELNTASVKKLAQSINQVGLRHPITVKRKGDQYLLIAGRHRLEACKKLGREHIAASIVTMTNDEARLWEIAENLHRSELTKLERDDNIAEWIKITERLQSSQFAKNESRRDDGRGHKPEGGIAAAARDLGVDKDDAHRAVKVASLSDEAKDAARETGLDNNRSALLAAARETEPQAQAEVIRTYKPSPAITKADPPDMYVVARQLAAKYSPLELAHLIDHLAEVIKEAA